MPTLAQEALFYWITARRFRLKSALAKDNSDEADDLAAVACHTENPVILRDALRLLDEDTANVLLERG